LKPSEVLSQRRGSLPCSSAGKSMVDVKSGSGRRSGSQIYVKVLVDAESSTYYSSVNTSGRGDSGATPALGDSVLRWRS